MGAARDGRVCRAEVRAVTDVWRTTGVIIAVWTDQLH